MKKTITLAGIGIAANKENRQIEATIFENHFAVHKSIRNPKLWSITQIPTGYKICDCRTKKDCLSCIIELSDNFDFSFTTIKQWHTMMKDRTLMQNMLTVIKKYRSY